jgi:hypothetical protein
MYFVRHQIAYLEAIGNLTTGELTPDDVVDEVLLRAYREFHGNVDEHTPAPAVDRPGAGDVGSGGEELARLAPPHARAPRDRHPGHAAGGVGDDARRRAARLLGAR